MTVQQTNSEISLLYPAETIAARVSELGAAIRRDAGESEVFLLGILKGASVFLADLLRAVPGEASFGFIEVVRDASDMHGHDALEIDFLRFTDIRGRKVYVLKDVVSTGVIETYLLSQLRIHDPELLRLVALIDRPAARTADLTVDHSAFTVEEGTFAGYGLENERRFGNLPWIGRVK